VLQEAVEAVRLAQERLDRLEERIEEFLPSWSLAPVVEALQALRGVDLIVAVTFVAEIGDLRRFDSPRHLMGYLGLVPGERSNGETVRRGGITKAGNSRVRQLLVESAWTYRHSRRELSTVQSDLYGDLDLDSLDAVDPIVKLQELTGQKIPKDAFKSVRTVVMRPRHLNQKRKCEVGDAGALNSRARTLRGDAQATSS
jgi:acyl carrier protein